MSGCLPDLEACIKEYFTGATTTMETTKYAYHILALLLLPKLHIL